MNFLQTREFLCNVRRDIETSIIINYSLYNKCMKELELEHRVVSNIILPDFKSVKEGLKKRKIN